jgi:hypothetical protein
MLSDDAKDAGPEARARRVAVAIRAMISWAHAMAETGDRVLWERYQAQFDRAGDELTEALADLIAPPTEDPK